MANTTDSSFDLVHRSPAPGILAVVFVSLFLLSIAATFLMTGGVPYPTPDSPIPQLRDYYAHFPDMIRVVSFLQLGASIPLGLFTASVVSRLLFHKLTAAGIHIALFGGITASLFLGVSSLSAWTLSQPGVATETGAMRAVELLAFATGGFGHVAALGLLLAGISVPCWFGGLMPRWACWFGLVVAAIAELSTLAMVFPSLAILLPLARFPALVWLLVAGFTIPKRRKANTEGGS